MKYYILTSMLLLSTLANAQELVKVESFTESFSKTVKVSGAFHIGFQYSGKHDFKNLHLVLPESTFGKLCIVLSSIDGKYKASMEHAITNPVSGKIRLDFNSKYNSELKRYKSNEIAALATIGKTCEDENKRVLAVGWSAEVGNENLILLIRSEARLDVVHAPSIENSEVEYDCSEIKDTYTVTFDKICQLSGLDIDKYKQLEIRRKHFRKYKNEIIKLAGEER